MTDQEYLDRCAIEAMKITLRSLYANRDVITDLTNNGLNMSEETAKASYKVVDFMLAERKKRMEEV